MDSLSLSDHGHMIYFFVSYPNNYIMFSVILTDEIPFVD